MYRTNINGYYIIKFNGKRVRKSNIMKLYNFLKNSTTNKKDEDDDDNNNNNKIHNNPPLILMYKK
jgi:hypothetical protein